MLSSEKELALHNPTLEEKPQLSPANPIAQSALKSTFIAAAICKCGGNEEKGNLLYTTFGSNGQWGLFDKQFGRSDAQEPDPEGRVLQWEKASVQEMKDKCTAIGFGPC